MAKQIFTGTSIFDSFQKLRSESGIPLVNSLDWFRKTINKEVSASEYNQLRNQIISDPIRGRRRFFQGMMYFFFYNQPEYQATLPFYDTFPLVLMLSRKKDTFFGVNLHYLPPKRRLTLFMEMQKFGQGNRIMLPYGTMIKDRKWKILKPCFRQYKVGLVTGNLINISAEDWPIAVNLPVERFKKQGKTAIWANTIREEQL